MMSVSVFIVTLCRIPSLFDYIIQSQNDICLLFSDFRIVFYRKYTVNSMQDNASVPVCLVTFPLLECNMQYRRTANLDEPSRRVE